MLNMENVHWFRGICNSVVGRVLPTLSNLEMKQNKLEDELKVITADVSNVKSKCEKAVSDMETVKSHHYKPAEEVNTLKMTMIHSLCKTRKHFGGQGYDV